MEGRLLRATWNDFGASRLACGATMMTQVQGHTPSQLRSEVRRLAPRGPGVYGMIDEAGDLIYLGKAKSLRLRLLSYFRRRSRDPKSGKILRHTRAIAWESAPSEFAALLRELELIRRWRPRCNVQGQPLRRSVTFVCIGRSPAAYVFLSRRPPEDVLARFGPVSNSRKIAEGVRRLNDLFGLRDCPQPQEMVFAEDIDLFPGERSVGCLRYEIGTCLGPCAGLCSQRDYLARVRAARTLLTGADDAPLRKLQEDMQAAAAAQAFERAAVLRDRLEALRWLIAKLAELRTVREQFSFLYPVRGCGGERLWYAIHGGRTLAVMPEPRTGEQADAAADLIETIFFRETCAQTLESYEHLDGMLLVASWFRRRPRERAKTLTPAEALRRCRLLGAQEQASRTFTSSVGPPC